MQMRIVKHPFEIGFPIQAHPDPPRLRILTSNRWKLLKQMLGRGRASRFPDPKPQQPHFCTAV